MKVDFEAIKAATDIVRVIASYGVQFKKSGRDYIALCPFHTEQTPSFQVTPAKRLFHCFGCEAKGNVIQFVAMKEGLSEREAAVKLLGTVPGVTRGRSLQTATVPKKTESLQTATTPKKILKPGDAAMLLQRVVNFYVRTFAKDRAGLDYLKGRNLADATTLGTFQIGYSNGSLLKVLPREGDILDGLKTLGVLRADGREPARHERQSRSHLRSAGKIRSRTHRIVNPRNGRLAGRRCAPVAQQPCCQPSHCMNLQNRN